MSRDEDDQDLRINRSQLIKQIESGIASQTDIEQHNTGRFLTQRTYSVQRVLGGDHSQGLRLKNICNRPTNAGLIIDDKECIHYGVPSTGPVASACLGSSMLNVAPVPLEEFPPVSVPQC